MAGFSPAGDTLERTGTDEKVTPDNGWNVILFNDPVNTIAMATHVVARVLETTVEEAERLVLTIHSDGRGMVYHGTKEDAEAKVAAFLAHQFWASMERTA